MTRPVRENPTASAMAATARGYQAEIERLYGRPGMTRLGWGSVLGFIVLAALLGCGLAEIVLEVANVI